MTYQSEASYELFSSSTNHRQEILNILQRHGAQNARVFGSVAFGVDTDDSDLDILVDPTPATTLMDIGTIRLKLHRLLDVSADVLTPKALPASFRDREMKEAKPI